jgi:hypothetical protein
MLNINMLNVVMLNVMAPLKQTDIGKTFLYSLLILCQNKPKGAADLKSQIMVTQCVRQVTVFTALTLGS